MELPLIPSSFKFATGETKIETPKVSGVAASTPSIIQGEPGITDIVEFGKQAIRDIPRSAVSIGLGITEKREEKKFVPGTGKFPNVEKFIFGDKPIYDYATEGQKFLESFGVSKQKAEMFGGEIGFPLAALSLIPVGSGKKEVAKELVEQVTKKYGKELATQIIKTGGKDLAEKAIVSGGDDLVMEVLKIEPRELLIKKLAGFVQEAKPVRVEQETMATAERALRAAKGTKILEKTTGEQAFKQAFGSLKGELPKPSFEGIRPVLNQQEIDTLFEMVKNHPTLDFYEQISTADGLMKLLGDFGEVPTESQLTLMQRVFGRELIDSILSKRPFITRAKEAITDVLNIPRTIMSSVDLSAPFRQGLDLMVNKPKEGFKAFGSMFKFFGSDNIFKAAMSEISQRPTFRLMKDSGIFFADTADTAIGLSKKEEAFISNLAEKMPLLGNLVKASNRAYVGFLNKLRADVFDDIASQYIRGGINPENKPEVFKSLARFINVASGRGSLGALEPAAPALAGVFFSPRFMASRLQMFNPAWYIKQTPQVRKLAAISYVRFIMSGIGLLSLAKLGGADVETDPTSADYRKIKIGKIRIDIWGGYQQWVRFGSQMILGKVKSTTSGKVALLGKEQFPFKSRLDWAFQFSQTKLAPVPGFLADLLRGETLIGDELDLKKEAYDRLIPMYIQDVVDAVREEGLAGGMIVAPTALFGIGAQTYENKSRKNKKGILPQLPVLPLPTLPKLPKLPSR